MHIWSQCNTILYIYMWLYIYMLLYIYMIIYIHIYIYDYMYIYIWLYVYIYIYIYIIIYIHIWLYIYIYVYIYIWLHIYIYTYLWCIPTISHNSSNSIPTLVLCDPPVGPFGKFGLGHTESVLLGIHMLHLRRRWWMVLPPVIW